MKRNKYQSKINHNAYNNTTFSSSNTIVTNLQTHLALISQISCLYPIIHQKKSIPTTSSSSRNFILNNHLHYYFKSKHEDLFYLNQSLIDSNNISNKTVKEINNHQRDLINEINWITQEKIDSINEKEKIDEELEVYYQTERQNKKQNPLTSNEKKKKLKELKTQFEKMEKAITQQKRTYGNIQLKNRNYINENKILIEKIKQKKIIYDQVISDVNEYKIAISKHKKLVSIESKDTHNSSSTNYSSKRNKSIGLFKKLFK